jgi:hypothetical protein
MNESQLRSPGHSSARTLLQVGGPAILASGVLFTAVGMGSGGPPRFFWCGFLGMPMMFVGMVMCMFGYIGVVQRYLAGESAPVVKDVVNYLGENTQPGVKAMSKAIAEGVIEAQSEQRLR